MHYLAYLSHTYQVKNKLEKSVLKYLQYVDRRLAEAKDVTEWTTNIIGEIKRCERENPRCKSVEASFEKERLTQDFILQINGICHFKLLKSK